MTLNKDRALVRWFFWSLSILDEFTETDLAWRIKDRGTNLCFFCQTIFVWTPLVLLLHLVFYGAILTALVVSPIYWFGVGHYAATVAGLLSLIGIVVAVVWYSNRDDKESAPRRSQRRDNEPSSPSIVWAWLVAMKRKVCPMIEFAREARS